MNTQSSMTGMQRHAPRRHTKELKNMATNNNTNQTERIEIEYPAMFTRMVYQKERVAPLAFSPTVGLSGAHTTNDCDILIKYFYK
jgi:hypothetical protein